MLNNLETRKKRMVTLSPVDFSGTGETCVTKIFTIISNKQAKVCNAITIDKDISFREPKFELFNQVNFSMYSASV